MRKKIIGVSVVVALLAILCAQSVTAQPTINVWTDKPQYEPGEKGILKISILNELDEPVEIQQINITYPWEVYDAEKGEWVGKKTIEGEPLATMTSKGTENDHYYKEVDFTIPSDGRATIPGGIDIDIKTSKGIYSKSVSLTVATPSWPIEIVDLDLWMTSIIVAVVICTIILAIAVFLSRRSPAPRFVAPPPPPKPKAKAA